MLKSLKEGDKKAFEQVYAIYQKQLYHFIFSITKSKYRSEEILQEVFIKIWNKRECIILDSSFSAYIYTIARNLTYNYLRNVANQDSLKKELWNTITICNEQTNDTILLSEYENILLSILQKIPKQKRIIYILSRHKGKSNNEIAEELGISPKTVKNHLWKTLEIIKSQLQPYLSEATIITLFAFTAHI